MPWPETERGAMVSMRGCVFSAPARPFLIQAESSQGTLPDSECSFSSFRLSIYRISSFFFSHRANSQRLLNNTDLYAWALNWDLGPLVTGHWSSISFALSLFPTSLLLGCEVVHLPVTTQRTRFYPPTHSTPIHSSLPTPLMRPLPSPHCHGKECSKQYFLFYRPVDSQVHAAFDVKET